MKRKTKLIAAAALVALALTMTLASCGTTANPSASPSTIYPESSATGTLPALKAYLTDAQDILDQLGTTVAALPSAVDGMSKTPDSTWTAAAGQLESIADQLDDEASALTALQPPSALQPVQDAVVKGIRTVRSGVEELAAKLDSKAESAATKKAKVQATVEGLKAQIEGLTKQLESAIGHLTGD